MADEILNIINRVNKAILSDRVKRVALTTVLSKHKPRIFEQGLNEDGAKLGVYSEKYGKYKTSIGKNPGFVNLDATGQMKADYGLIVQGNEYAFGFQNSENAKKMGYMQDLYDAGIAHLSDPEIDLFIQVLNDELGSEI